MKELILCSSSPRRKELVHKFNLPFVIYHPKVKEGLKISDPYLLSRKLALSKAMAGARKHQKGIALGADTIVILGKHIIGKPANRADAKRILRKLSGSYHEVCTGFALIDCATGKTIVDHEISKVRMKKLSKKEINDASGKHLDKAGAYAVQEKEDRFVEIIDGDYFNVVGLPLNKIRKHLSKLFL